jgi:uncharacterized membrane protein
MLTPRIARLGFAVLFVIAGLLHFAFPTAYVSIVPSALPMPLALVYLTGALEFIGGIALIAERSRRAAGILLIVLLILIWPANIQMLLDARADDDPLGWQLLLWIRLPLQLLLIAGLWYATRRDA